MTRNREISPCLTARREAIFRRFRVQLFFSVVGAKWDSSRAVGRVRNISGPKLRYIQVTFSNTRWSA